MPPSSSGFVLHRSWALVLAAVGLVGCAVAGSDDDLIHHGDGAVADVAGDGAGDAVDGAPTDGARDGTADGTDGTALDTGASDGAVETGLTDSTVVLDTGLPDTTLTIDTGLPDTTPDTGTLDTGTLDTGTLDTGTPDTGTPDTGTPDTGTLDTGVLDTGSDALFPCKVDTDCFLPLNCCVVTSKSCGVKVGPICVPFGP